MRLQLLLVFLASISPAFAEPQVVEIRATAEHRIVAGEAPATAQQIALFEAGRKAWREVATRLEGAAEKSALLLKPHQIDALLPAIVEFKEQSVLADAGADGTTIHVQVTARLSIAEIARRLEKLGKDPAAVATLVETWGQSEGLYRRLAGQSEPEQERLTRRLRVNLLAAHVTALLAHTEEGPGSARVSTAKRRQRAMQLAEAAVVMGPDVPEAYWAMGDALIEADGPPEAAEAAYRQALLLIPTSSSAHIKLAEALRREGELTEAVAELREALRLDANSALAHSDLGLIMAAQQDVPGAIAEYQEALRLDPDFIDAHNNLAITFARQQRFPEAVAQFREIVRVDPDSVLGHYNLGIALADLDKDDESAEAFRHVVRVNPNHYNARYNLGELLRLESKFDEAVKQFREYLRIAPDLPQNQRNIRRAREFVATHENP